MRPMVSVLAVFYDAKDDSLTSRTFARARTGRAGSRASERRRRRRRSTPPRGPSSGLSRDSAPFRTHRSFPFLGFVTRSSPVTIGGTRHRGSRILTSPSADRAGGSSSFPARRHDATPSETTTTMLRRAIASATRVAARREVRSTSSMRSTAMRSTAPRRRRETRARGGGSRRIETGGRAMGTRR